MDNNNNLGLYNMIINQVVLSCYVSRVYRVRARREIEIITIIMYVLVKILAACTVCVQSLFYFVLSLFWLPLLFLQPNKCRVRQMISSLFCRKTTNSHSSPVAFMSREGFSFVVLREHAEQRLGM